MSQFLLHCMWFSVGSSFGLMVALFVRGSARENGEYDHALNGE